LIVPSIVISELNTLKKKAKGSDKIACNIALQIAEDDSFSIAEIEKTDHVDNLLLEYCTPDDVLCTNDKNLRKRARKRGITVVYLRQHRFLEIDGYIRHQ
ncbi:MAG: hypothetical protein BZ138_01150, partial [Methanosphaera sp. rholeuAM270]